MAAAVLYVHRRSQGLAPYWPSALRSLTGYAAATTPELASAVAGTQRLQDRLLLPPSLLSYVAGPGGGGGAAAVLPALEMAGGGAAAGAPVRIAAQAAPTPDALSAPHSAVATPPGGGSLTRERSVGSGTGGAAQDPSALLATTSA